VFESVPKKVPFTPIPIRRNENLKFHEFSH
jgi:hypothetical protein